MNSAWKEVFGGGAKTKTLNCKRCSKQFKTKCGLAVHVTKVHRKRNAAANRAEDCDEKKEGSHQVEAARKKRRSYSMNFKKRVLSKMENKNSQERKEFLQKSGVPAKTFEKWSSSAKKRQILHEAVVRPFKKRKRKCKKKIESK